MRLFQSIGKMGRPAVRRCAFSLRNARQGMPALRLLRADPRRGRGDPKGQRIPRETGRDFLQ